MNDGTTRVGTGCPVFAADLAEKMKAHGFTQASLARLVINPETGQPLNARAIGFYVGSGKYGLTELVSYPIWVQLKAIFPELYEPDGMSDRPGGAKVGGIHKRRRERLDPRLRTLYGTAAKGRRIHHPAFGSGTVVGPAQEAGRVRVLFDADAGVSEAAQ